MKYICIWSAKWDVQIWQTFKYKRTIEVHMYCSLHVLHRYWVMAQIAMVYIIALSPLSSEKLQMEMLIICFAILMDYHLSICINMPFLSIIFDKYISIYSSCDYCNTWSNIWSHEKGVSRHKAVPDDHYGWSKLSFSAYEHFQSLDMVRNSLNIYLFWILQILQFYISHWDIKGILKLP